MPANRPGRIHYPAPEANARTHGQVIKRGNFVGQIIKQKATGWDSTVAAQSAIPANEPYAMIVKGKILVDNVSGFAKGDLVYIDPDDFTLTETAATNYPFGTVTEAPGDRGTPAGKCWVDLDVKANPIGA